MELYDSIRSVIDGTGILDSYCSGDLEMTTVISIVGDNVTIVMVFECMYKPENKESAIVHAKAIESLLPEIKYINYTDVTVIVYEADNAIDIRVIAEFYISTAPTI